MQVNKETFFIAVKFILATITNVFVQYIILKRSYSSYYSIINTAILYSAGAYEEGFLRVSKNCC